MQELWDEFLVSETPSMVIQTMQILDILPVELEALTNVPQDAEHHPEIWAFNHTMMVIDFAAIISKREQLNKHDDMILRYAALCHDLGKATNTQVSEDGRITSYGHAESGVEPTIKMLNGIGLPFEWISIITPLVREHMAHIGYYMPDVTTRQVRRLMQRLQPTNIQMLAYLVEADMSGRGGKYFGQGLPEKFRLILAMADSIDVAEQDEISPIITGDDLQALGFTPGPVLGQVKQLVFEAQMRGEFVDQRGGYQWVVNHIIGGAF